MDFLKRVRQAVKAVESKNSSLAEASRKYKVCEKAIRRRLSKTPVSDVMYTHEQYSQAYKAVKDGVCTVKEAATVYGVGTRALYRGVKEGPHYRPSLRAPQQRHRKTSSGSLSSERVKTPDKRSSPQEQDSTSESDTDESPEDVTNMTFVRRVRGAVASVRSGRLTVAEAVAKYKVSTSTVHRRLNEAKTLVSSKTRRKVRCIYTLEQYTSAYNAVTKRGMTRAMAAKTYGVPVKTLIRGVRLGPSYKPLIRRPAKTAGSKKSKLVVSLNGFQMRPQLKSANYSSEDYTTALDLILKGTMTVIEASRKYGVPATTLFGALRRLRPAKPSESDGDDVPTASAPQPAAAATSSAADAAKSKLELIHEQLNRSSEQLNRSSEKKNRSSEQPQVEETTAVEKIKSRPLSQFKFKSYSREDYAKAVENLMSGAMTLMEASRAFRVPVSTLWGATTGAKGKSAPSRASPARSTSGTSPEKTPKSVTVSHAVDASEDSPQVRSFSSKYSSATISQAVQDVLSGAMSAMKAARKYGVPQSTLSYKVLRLQQDLSNKAKESSAPPASKTTVKEASVLPASKTTAKTWTWTDGHEKWFESYCRGDDRHKETYKKAMMLYMKGEITAIEAGDMCGLHNSSILKRAKALQQLVDGSSCSRTRRSSSSSSSVQPASEKPHLYKQSVRAAIKQTLARSSGRTSYPVEHLVAAVDAVQGGWTRVRAAATYGVSVNTLKRYCRKPAAVLAEWRRSVTKKGSFGSKPALAEEQCSSDVKRGLRHSLKFHRSYSLQSLSDAVDCVKRDGLKLEEAASLHGVPLKTLRRYCAMPAAHLREWRRLLAERNGSTGGKRAASPSPATTIEAILPGSQAAGDVTAASSSRVTSSTISRRYSPEQLADAVAAVKSGRLTQKQAAQQYCIPLTTLNRNVQRPSPGGNKQRDGTGVTNTSSEPAAKRPRRSVSTDVRAHAYNVPPVMLQEAAHQVLVCHANVGKIADIYGVPLSVLSEHVKACRQKARDRKRRQQLQRKTALGLTRNRLGGPASAAPRKTVLSKHLQQQAGSLPTLTVNLGRKQSIEEIEQMLRDERLAREAARAEQESVRAEVEQEVSRSRQSSVSTDTTVIDVVDLDTYEPGSGADPGPSANSSESQATADSEAASDKVAKPGEATSQRRRSTGGRKVYTKRNLDKAVAAVYHGRKGIYSAQRLFHVPVDVIRDGVESKKKANAVQALQEGSMSLLEAARFFDVDAADLLDVQAPQQPAQTATASTGRTGRKRTHSDMDKDSLQSDMRESESVADEVVAGAASSSVTDGGLSGNPYYEDISDDDDNAGSDDVGHIKDSDVTAITSAVDAVSVDSNASTLTASTVTCNADDSVCDDDFSEYMMPGMSAKDLAGLIETAVSAPAQTSASPPPDGSETVTPAAATVSDEATCMPSLLPEAPSGDGHFVENLDAQAPVLGEPQELTSEQGGSNVRMSFRGSLDSIVIQHTASKWTGTQGSEAQHSMQPSTTVPYSAGHKPSVPLASTGHKPTGLPSSAGHKPTQPPSSAGHKPTGPLRSEAAHTGASSSVHKEMPVLIAENSAAQRSAPRPQQSSAGAQKTLSTSDATQAGVALWNELKRPKSVNAFKQLLTGVVTSRSSNSGATVTTAAALTSAAVAVRRGGVATDATAATLINNNATSKPSPRYQNISSQLNISGQQNLAFNTVNKTVSEARGVHTPFGGVVPSTSTFYVATRGASLENSRGHGSVGGQGHDSAPPVDDEPRFQPIVIQPETCDNSSKNAPMFCDWRA